MATKKVAVVTGGARGIGKAIVDEFKRQGVSVCVIDVLDNDYFVKNHHHGTRFSACPALSRRMWQAT